MTRIFLTGILMCSAACAQVGIFEAQSDVGAVLHEGSAEFDDAAKSYTLTGSGENMWAAQDQFHFVWKKVTAADLTLTADIAIAPGEGDGHRKGVLMIRQSMDTDSVYVDAAKHGEGLTSLQFRSERGAATHEIESNVSGPARLRIEKRGDFFYLWIANKGEDLQFSGGAAHVVLQAPFYVGIGVCAHRKDAVEKAVFTNVELNTHVEHPEMQYSTVETVMLSGDARSGYVSRKRLTAPGWSADGHSLTFESEGKRQQTVFTPLRTAAPVGAPIAAGSSVNTYSVAADANGTMQLWRNGGDAGEEIQVTSDELNNVSPRLSPDGKYVLVLSYAKGLKQIPDTGELILRVVALGDGNIRSLASFIGGPDSLGTSPWSPDGRRIVFASYQSID